MKYFNYTITKKENGFEIQFGKTHSLLPGVTIFIQKEQVHGNIALTCNSIKYVMDKAEQKQKDDLYTKLADEIMKLTCNK